MFDTLNPQQQAQLIDLAQRSFGNQKLGNAQRAKDALMNYPDFAARIAQQHGIVPTPPVGGNGDRDNSMREFQVDNAVYNSLRSGPQDDVGSMSAQPKTPMPRARPQSRSTQPGPDMAPSEGGREARADAANRDMNSRDGGFHRTKPDINSGGEARNGGGADNTVPEGGDAIGLGGKVAAGAATAAGAYGAYRYATRNRGGQQQSTSPEAGASEPGTAVAKTKNIPRYEGEIEPDARPQSNIDSMIESSIDDSAPRLTEQRKLPAPPPRLAYSEGQDPRAAQAPEPEGPPQLKGPRRAYQYPTPADNPDDLATLADVLRHGAPPADTGGVERTIARGRPRFRLPGR